MIRRCRSHACGTNFARADMVFSNLECCLYDPPRGHAVENEGFFASPDDRGEALRVRGYRRGRHRQQRELRRGGDHRIDRAARSNSAFRHTGAGANVAAARAPSSSSATASAMASCNAVRCYWPTNHEAGANSTGIAVIRAHTAYQVPMHKTRRRSRR